MQQKQANITSRPPTRDLNSIALNYVSYNYKLVRLILLTTGIIISKMDIVVDFDKKKKRHYPREVRTSKPASLCTTIAT